MKRILSAAVLSFLVLLAGCSDTAKDASPQPGDADPVSTFISGMGCDDPTCTDPAHHHDCPADCTDYDHHHSCGLDCTDASHHHSEVEHHDETHH